MIEQDGNGVHQDRACRSCLRALALFLALPNLILLTVAFILLNLRITLLNPTYIKQVPISDNLYEQVPSLVVDGLFEQVRYEEENEDWITEFEKAYDRENLETFLRALIPPSWIQGVLEDNTDALFEWLEGRRPDLNLRIGMRELRKNVQEPAVRNALKGLFSDLPQCKRGESFYSGDYPSCIPPGDDFELLIDEAIASLQDSIPPHDYLTPPVESRTYESSETEASIFVRGVYRTLITASWAIWVMFMILMGVILLLAVRSLNEAMVWTGWHFLIVGAVSALVLGVLYITLSLSLRIWITSYFVEDSLIAGSIVGEFISVYVKDILFRWIITAGIFIVLGTYGVVGSRFLRKLQGEGDHVRNSRL